MINDDSRGDGLVKILLVTFSDNADHQDTTFGMYEALKDDKEVTVFLLAIKEPRVFLAKSDCTWLVNCPKRPGICKKTFDLPLLWSIIRKIKQNHFDAVYFESLHVWNLPIMAALKGKVRIYHVIHDVIPHENDKSWRQVDLFNKVLVRLADRIVLCNKKFIPTLISRYQVPSEKVRYLELWRRYPDYTPPTYSKRVLFFGRMNPYKGVDNLLSIVRLCPHIHFDLVGKVDSQVENVVHELQKEPNVHLKSGYVSNEEMEHYFISSDWAIIPYSSATQSGIIIDSYKYGRPVIAFSVGAIEEQVKDGVSGYLVPPGANEKFASVLKKALSMDKGDYLLMSKQAYEYGLKKYAAAGAITRFKQLFEADGY